MAGTGGTTGGSGGSSGGSPDGGGMGGDMGSTTSCKPDQPNTLFCKPTGAMPKTIKETGLFPSAPDFSKRDPSLHEFAPSPELWSDGMGKQRFLLLPAGMKINNTDPKRWEFPSPHQLTLPATISSVRLRSSRAWSIGESWSPSPFGRSWRAMLCWGVNSAIGVSRWRSQG
jgi:hypothetical protein